MYASLLQFAPTLGAPSLRTASTFLFFNYFLSLSNVYVLVISPLKDIVPGTFLISSRSTPMIVELGGIVFAATCIQPPGAAQRSITAEALFRKLYLRLSWISLYAALDRYPWVFAKR